MIFGSWSLAISCKAVDIDFSGFGTAAGGTVLSKSGAEFVADPVSRKAYDDEFRFDVESMIALRGHSKLNDDFAVTLQLIGKSSDAEMEFAYATYNVAPSIEVNAGKFRLPLFFYSVFLDTAYAYHWVRPPTDTYGIPAVTLTGINSINRYFIHDTSITTQIWYGSDKDEDEGHVADITKSFGISLLCEYNFITLRGVYHTLNLGLDTKPFIVSNGSGVVLVDPPGKSSPIRHWRSILITVV